MLPRPITLDECEVPAYLQLTDDGAGFTTMLNVVLPLFNLGTAAVALGGSHTGGVPPKTGTGRFGDMTFGSILPPSMNRISG